MNKTGEKALPKSLRGAVCAQYRTVKGKKYGPYWFRFWREGGMLRKEYVPVAQLSRAVEACARHRSERREASRTRAAMRQQSQGFNALVAAYEALLAELRLPR